MTFTDDGFTSSSINLQAEAKEKEINKFIIFVNKNSDYPLWVKMKVLDACIVTSLTYACESWLRQNIQKMNSLYMKAIKAMLGVRQSTPNDLCLIEIGYPTLLEFVRYKQHKFYIDHISTRINISDNDPLMFCYNLTLMHTPSLIKYFQPLTCPYCTTLYEIKSTTLLST